MSVGAKPSDQCQVLFDKFMKKFEEVEAQNVAKAAADAAAKANPAAPKA